MSKVLFATQASKPTCEVTFRIKSNKREKKIFSVERLVEIRGLKAIGNKFPVQKIVSVVDTTDLANNQIEKTSESGRQNKKSDQKPQDQLDLF